MSHLEDMFAAYVRMLAPDLGAGMRAEYPVGEERRYRFDFAFPDEMVGIELQGGLYSGGAHARPRGIQRDAHKLNFATLHGWRVLFFTTDDVEGDPERCIAQLRALIERTK